MIWWASQPSRARAESIGIAELEERSDWLRGVSWRIGNDARLVADFEILHLGDAVALTITYPSFFPNMPPQVTPRGDIRLSDHQYGAGGELCLEFRPDNWEPDMTGAMMIESAHRLLKGEKPAPEVQAEVESAHRMTLGQEIRNADFRLVLSADAKTQLSALPYFILTELVIEELFHADHWMAFPKRLGSIETPIWNKPKGIAGMRDRVGYAIRFPDETEVPIAANYSFMKTLFEAAKVQPPLDALEASSQELPLLIIHRDRFRLISLSSGTGERAVYDYRMLELPEDGPRLSGEYTTLSEKSVAIVGCGSVGSKIAISLTRAGVPSFVLVDGDVLVPGNLVRNELDMRSVGLNKPDALAARIKEINPNAKVIARRLTLGGQESSASTDAALQKIASADLIIDATADPQIFNMCGAVARIEKKLFLWGEVFAGGIGGLIARVRPDHDPPPHLARRQIASWCRDQDVPWTHGNTGHQYALSIDVEKPPLMADDADVGVFVISLNGTMRKMPTSSKLGFAVSTRRKFASEKGVQSKRTSTGLVPSTTAGCETHAVKSGLKRRLTSCGSSKLTSNSTPSSIFAC